MSRLKKLPISLYTFLLFILFLIFDFPDVARIPVSLGHTYDPSDAEYKAK